MPSAAAQDVLQAILEQRAAAKRRQMAAPPAGPPAVLPFANRIAGAFEASQPVRQVDELSAPITLPFAARNKLGDWHGRMPNVLKTFADPRTSPLGPAAVARLFMDPAGEAGRQVEAGEQLAQPFTQFNDPNVDPVKQGADLALTAMGGSAAVPAEANSLQAGLKIFSDYSKIGHNIPITETAPIYVPGSGPKLIEKTFDPATLKPGDRLVGFVGDRSHIGEDLGGVRIGDKETIFKKPVKSEGGSGYMSHEFNPQDAYWASNRNPIRAYENQLGAHQEAAAKAGGDVYAVSQAMSATGGDFSMQGTMTALEMLRRQPLTAKARESLYAAIDEAMIAPWGKKKEFPGIPDWPGMKAVMGKGGEKYLQGIGTGRAKLVKKLDTDLLRKMGAPNIGAARYAITSPLQRNASPLESGHGWFKLGEKTQRLSPEQVIRGHDTYPWVVTSPGGEYVGTRPMPVEVLFPGLARRTRGMNASGQQKTATTSDVFEILTPQKLDRVMQWLASPQGQKLGVAGAVTAGLLTAGEANNLFGDEAEPPPGA